MESFFVDSLGSKYLNVIVASLTVLLAVASGLNVWVNSVEDKRAHDVQKKVDTDLANKQSSILEITKQLDKKSEEARRLQQDIVKQSNILEYASTLGNSPRISAEWGNRVQGGPHSIVITNNDLKTFGEVKVGLLVKGTATYHSGTTIPIQQPKHIELSVPDIPFQPSSKLSLVLPYPSLDLIGLNNNDIKHAKVEMKIVIYLDEFITINDRIHGIAITAQYNDKFEVNPVYTTTSWQPLFIHKELKYRIDAEKS